MALKDKTMVICEKHFFELQEAGELDKETSYLFSVVSDLGEGETEMSGEEHCEICADIGFPMYLRTKCADPECDNEHLMGVDPAIAQAFLEGICFAATISGQENVVFLQEGETLGSDEPEGTVGFTLSERGLLKHERKNGEWIVTALETLSFNMVVDQIPEQIH